MIGMEVTTKRLKLPLDPVCPYSIERLGQKAARLLDNADTRVARLIATDTSNEGGVA
jgi:hypothetical protein